MGVDEVIGSNWVDWTDECMGLAGRLGKVRGSAGYRSMALGVGFSSG